METVSTSSLTTSFPVGHKKTSLEIKGNKTDIIVCRYDDYFMVLVTQLGCVGTILHARKEEGFALDPTFSVSVIFGKRDEPLLVACGRQLIEHISSCGSSRPLVLTLGLKDHSPGAAKTPMEGQTLAEAHLPSASIATQRRTRREAVTTPLSLFFAQTQR